MSRASAARGVRPARLEAFVARWGVTPPDLISDEIVHRVRTFVEQARTEDAITYLRHDVGLSKALSMHALRLAGVPFNEAKETVHTSSTWSDRYASDEEFQHRVQEAITESFADCPGRRPAG